MLTTKVVSNKKPPLLSDSESGGSTSLFNPHKLKLAEISTYFTSMEGVVKSIEIHWV